MKFPKDQIAFLKSRFKGFNTCFVLLIIAASLGLYVVSSLSGSTDFLQVILVQNKSSTSDFIQKAVSKLSSFVYGSEPGEVNPDGELANWTSCHFPRLDPFDPAVMKIAGLDKKTLTCVGAMPDLTYVQGDWLMVNKTKIKENFSTYNISCKYQEVIRQDRDSTFVFSEIRKTFSESIQLPRDTEFILVVCEGTSNVSNNISAQSNSSIGNSTTIPTQTVLSRNYFALIPKLDSLNEFENVKLRKRAVEVAPKETLNVIMIAFDSVSRYSFLRAMNRTYDLLMNELMSFDMTMHSQVGKNTFPNIISLLTGTSEEDTGKWWDRTKSIDELDLIWKEFEKAGYRTLFSEDYPKIGGFNFGLKGFYKVPTTYYSKAISFAIEQDASIFKAGRYCIGNQPEVLFHLGYLKRFLESFPKKPLFALIYLTRVSHDDIRWLNVIDEHIKNYYTQLNTSGLLNNTLLISFADHGIRFGPLRYTYMGDVENRTPFLALTLPPWFLKKYSDVAQNLKTNTRRLTSHFDTHATMQDILYFKPSGENPLGKSKHGISLFNEIPKNRTCKDASIPQDFCLCEYKNSIIVDINSAISVQLSKVVVHFINTKIDQKLCLNLTLHNVLEVLRLDSFDKQSDLVKVNFKLKIETVPGNGVFESVVQALHTNVEKSIDELTVDQLQNVTVGNGVDRLNMYIGQSDCAEDAKMKLFCYCKNLLKSNT